MKKRMAITLTAVLLTVGAACTPAELAYWDKELGRSPGETQRIYCSTPLNAWNTNTCGGGTPYGVWDRLAQCESHGEWNYGPHSNWGSRIFHGGLQFHPNTWSAFKPAGYPTYAYQASREQQIVVGQKVLAAQGWGAWPTCSRKLGLR